MVNIYLLGQTLEQIESHPQDDGFKAYFKVLAQQLLHSSSNCKWQLIVRNLGSLYIYVYLCNFHSKIHTEKKVQTGIAVVTNNHCFVSIQKELIPLFEEVNAILAEDGKLLKCDDNNNLIYSPKQFRDIKDYLKRIHSMLESTLKTQLQSTKIKEPIIKPMRIVHLTGAEKETEIENFLNMYGGVNITSPTSNNNIYITDISKEELDFLR